MTSLINEMQFPELSTFSLNILLLLNNLYINVNIVILEYLKVKGSYKTYTNL